MKQAKAEVQKKEQALQALVTKYKIRFAGSGDDEEGGSSKPKQAAGSSKGVLA
jgi:hypothetical protein